MAKINEIVINGFKAFPSLYKIELGGKHLLMYGENGSGKSSIYYALHCIFNSYRKPDNGKKYFDKNNSQNLINRFFIPKDERDIPYVAVNWYDGGRNVFLSVVSEHGCDGFDRLSELETYFVNHQLLNGFFNFTNSNSINLFPIFQREILPYKYIDEQGTYLSLMYEQIEEEASKLGNKSSTKKINEMIDIFNRELEGFIGDINIAVSDIYKNHFKADGEQDLSIVLTYPEENPNPDVYFDGFRLKWDNRLIKNQKGELERAKNKSLIEPIIGISIKEDGNEIPKPHVYFNEAKLTAIALSIRFSLLKGINPADDTNPPEGSFLALDDMLISLDMSNRAKVVDFLLKISDKYKIYLFTHDKMFFEYFKHKTKKNQDAWVYKEIYMDYDKTPYIRNSEDYLGQAEHYIKQHEYEIAGNFLRKEAEAFCKDFLPKKKQLTGDFAHLDLNGLIMNCKDYAAESGVIDISIFNELDEHRKFILNPSSHDSYDVAKYGHEVKRCLQTLRKLREIIIRPFLKFGSQVEFTLKTPKPRISEYKFILTLCDDFRIIIMPGEVPVISKGMINYQVYEDGNNKKGVQSDNTTIKHFFEYNYEKSDKTKDASYLNSVIESESGNPISAFFDNINGSEIVN